MSGRSYIGRALLELAMVFLGVLGAFGVENWRISREERAMGVQYLQRLAEDLRGDSATMAGNWSRALDVKMEAMRAVGPFVRGQTRSVGDTLAFMTALAAAGAGGFTAWQFQTPTMDDLRSTGNLRVIGDPELRGAIVDYYRGLDAQAGRIRGRLPIYPMAVHALIPAEARDAMDMEMVRGWGVDRVLSRVRSEEFQDTFNQEVNSGLFQLSVLPSLLDRTNDLLARVEAALAALR